MPQLQEPLRRPIPPDQDNSQEDKLIKFFHPAYPFSAPPLLQFVAVDYTVASDNQSRSLGICYDFAKAALGIVADNRWDDTTYIATNDRSALTVSSASAISSPFARVKRPRDGVLPILPPRLGYYFVIDDPTNLYPVIPSFDHWRFPHARAIIRELPDPWNTLQICHDGGQITDGEGRKMNARFRDKSCRVTGSNESCEAAHIVPYAENEWFQSNSMDSYCRIPGTAPPIDNESNLIALRSDIHGLFDQHRFAFVPKMGSNIDVEAEAQSPDTPLLVMHAVSPRRSREISEYYHNRPLQSPIVGIEPEFLFARFALAILRDEIFSFFSTGTLEYTVRLYDTGSGHQHTERLGRDALRARSQIFPSSTDRTRSVSPKKRKAPSITPQAGVVGEGSDQREAGEEVRALQYRQRGCSECRDDVYHVYTHRDSPRGRPRYRSPSYYTQKRDEAQATRHQNLFKLEQEQERGQGQDALEATTVPSEGRELSYSTHQRSLGGLSLVLTATTSSASPPETPDQLLNDTQSFVTCYESASEWPLDNVNNDEATADLSAANTSTALKRGRSASEGGAFNNSIHNSPTLPQAKRRKVD
jgi:hypothetical protein